MLDFFLNPNVYGIPKLDAWLLNWLAYIDQFIRINTYATSITVGIISWVVVKTPWKWDDVGWEWLKNKFLKKAEPKDEIK